jgi:hypothetical protein
VSYAKRLAAAIPGAGLTVVPSTGRMLLMENPESVTTLLTILIDDAPEKIGA